MLKLLQLRGEKSSNCTGTSKRKFKKFNPQNPPPPQKKKRKQKEREKEEQSLSRGV